jgi:hypothetical protein
MQLPDLPPTGQVHGPPGPQTIGCGGAASLINLQSESMLQGFCGIAQIPHPVSTPPGLHEKALVQSRFDEHAVAPSEPESTGQAMFDMATCQLPPLHVAKTLQP